MKKQVIFIHGGDMSTSYKEYISFLKKYKIDKKKINRKKWHQDYFSKALGNKFEIIRPQMPNVLNARYLEWKIWFKKFFPFLNTEVILVGGSLGGLFLSKYLSENKFPKKIKGLFLVSAPFGDKEKYYLADFHFNPKNLSKLEKQCKQVNLYHSRDDKMVSFGNFLKYKKYLPNANYYEFKNRGHFMIEKFPEIIKHIKSLK
jgi:uncharacterized protein